MATHKKRKRNPDDPSFLPEDIIYSIFLWLPVKALLRFKSVCKSLLSLISSRDFIKTHLSISTNDPRFTHHHLLLGHHLLGYWTCSVYSLLNEPVPKTIKLDYLDGILQVIVGYCHGLVCFRSHDNYIFLWNPSTRESRKLPKPLDIIFKDRNPNYGFGYDEFNDDYKVFVICGTYKLSVYSSKSNCWRMIGDYPFEKMGSFWGHFANGAIHWFIVPDILTPDTLYQIYIVSLDVKTETYRKLLLPKSVELAHRVTFCTFGKSLAILLQNKHVVDIWVIQDCCVEDRWKKLFTIPYTNILTKSSHLKQVCIYETDGVMLRSDSTILLHNSRDKTFKYPLQLSFGDQGVYMHSYVESLVSPHV